MHSRYVDIRLTKGVQSVEYDMKKINKSIRREKTHPEEGADRSQYFMVKVGLTPNTTKDLMKLHTIVEDTILKLIPGLDVVWIEAGEFRKSAGVLAGLALACGLRGCVETKKDGNVPLEEFVTILATE